MRKRVSIAAFFAAAVSVVSLSVFSAFGAPEQVGILQYGCPQFHKAATRKNAPRRFFQKAEGVGIRRKHVRKTFNACNVSCHDDLRS